MADRLTVRRSAYDAHSHASLAPACLASRRNRMGGEIRTGPIGQSQKQSLRTWLARGPDGGLGVVEAVVVEAPVAIATTAEVTSDALAELVVVASSSDAQSLSQHAQARQALSR